MSILFKTESNQKMYKNIFASPLTLGNWLGEPLNRYHCGRKEQISFHLWFSCRWAFLKRSACPFLEKPLEGMQDTSHSTRPTRLWWFYFWIPVTGCNVAVFKIGFCYSFLCACFIGIFNGVGFMLWTTLIGRIQKYKYKNEQNSIVTLSYYVFYGFLAKLVCVGA